MVVALALLLGCPDEEANSLISTGEVEACEDQTSVDLIAGQHTDSGDVTVSNDEDTLYVTYSTQDGWELDEVHLHVACDVADIPQSKRGNPIPGRFDYKAEGLSGTEYSFAIPLEDIECLAECGEDLVIAAHASVVNDDGTSTQQETAWGDGEDFDGANWAMWFSHEVECCDEPPEEPECEGWRTQTQGGWGAAAHGDNPGVYRDTNFDSCIGTLVAGDSAGYTLTLTSAEAVEAFLPQGGTASALSEDEEDVTVSSGGVLAGQVVALSLSVAFDACDPDFSEQDGALGDLVAQSGDCEGMSASDILAAGNCVLSGRSDCGVDASTINECLSDANESHVDGTDSSGYLCQE